MVRLIRTEGLRNLKGAVRIKGVKVGEDMRANATTVATCGIRDLQRQLGRSPNRRMAVSDEPIRRFGLMLVEANLVEVDPDRPVA